MLIRIFNELQRDDPRNRRLHRDHRVSLPQRGDGCCSVDLNGGFHVTGLNDCRTCEAERRQKQDRSCGKEPLCEGGKLGGVSNEIGVGLFFPLLRFCGALAFFRFALAFGICLRGWCNSYDERRIVRYRADRAPPAGFALAGSWREAALIGPMKPGQTPPKMSVQSPRCEFSCALNRCSRKCGHHGRPEIADTERLIASHIMGAGSIAPEHRVTKTSAVAKMPASKWCTARHWLCPAPPARGTPDAAQLSILAKAAGIGRHRGFSGKRASVTFLFMIPLFQIRVRFALTLSELIALSSSAAVQRNIPRGHRTRYSAHVVDPKQGCKFSGINIVRAIRPSNHGLPRFALRTCTRISGKSCRSGCQTYWSRTSAACRISHNAEKPCERAVDFP